MRTFAILFIALSLAAYTGRNLFASSPAAPKSLGTSQPVPTFNSPLLLSSDYGNSWKEMGRELPSDTAVRCALAHDGALYLGMEKGGLYHSMKPESGIWEQENIVDIFPGFEENNLQNAIFNIFQGKSGPYVCIPTDGFYQKITDSGRWKRFHPEAQYQSVHTLLEQPGGVLYVCYDRDTYKSEDQGKTWKLIYDQGSIQDLTSVNGALIASTFQGLKRSTDGGEHWETVYSEKGAGLRLFTVKGAENYVVAINSIKTRESMFNPISLRKSVDNGQTWQRLDNGSAPSGIIYDFEQLGDYLFCSHQDGIFRSGDGGKSWELLCRMAAPNDSVFYQLVVSGQKLFAIRMEAGC